uniref:T-complex protein 1 subunit eta n=1 Tax=Scophthalmus maximus TaxID=52904 RepID=A0A8D3D1I5_SCOMX
MVGVPHSLLFCSRRSKLPLRLCSSSVQCFLLFLTIIRKLLLQPTWFPRLISPVFFSPSASFLSTISPLQPTPVILLKEGTDTSQGIPQLISNINACQVVAEAVRTTLGPRGMDKLMVDGRGKATISNDGATILKLLDVVHPAAKTLVDIARSQDAEVGDGTTSVTLLASEFLKQLKPYVEEGLHPQTIIRAFLPRFPKASENGQLEQLLEKCASTALNSKLIADQKEFFSKMVVDAVMSLDELLSLKMIGIKKVQGGALEESQLISGVAFKKTFSYAGFEMQPKRYDNPKIALLNVELELKAEKENAEVRVKNVEDYQAIVDAEWNILYDKLEKIHLSGAKVVLSKLPIGDVATQYFADRDLFCAGRVQEEDLKRTMMACGGSIQTSVGALTDDVLGHCELFEEVQVGGERYNFLKGCTKAKTCTIILRGGAEQFTEETERSLHDAIMIVRRAMKNDSIVAGGGAIEMELSKYLRDYSRTIPGKQQLLIGAYAKALEIIPRQLCDNAGFDATNILNKLRAKHAQGGMWYGVDINNEDISDNYATCVWEPSIVRINALTAASEAACLILSVDETIKNPRSSVDGPPGGAGRGRGRGRPHAH